ncbi:lysophospholipid acyltransferase family protein [Yoonia sp. 2307UL14-13]|uniref:lysophospholipid acyltransferase family protein n=1 Tax=Yoonia sp. 2307UL14-13 TaxID=3126506 RepID=UPI00309E6EAC
MAETWYGEAPVPDPPRMTPGGWVRVVLRAVPLVTLVFGGLIVMLLVRLIERPIYGLRRPVTPYITQCVCRGFFVILGMTHKTVGHPMKGPGAVVANHVSWLDVFALNLRKRIYFVSKAEVSQWPGVGWLARATGTVFIERNRRSAAAQVALFRERLAVGHKLLFFPEGTSTDGQRILPFKPTLFAAFFDPAFGDALQIQPVTLCYQAPDGQDPRYYGWWGDMRFGGSMVTMLATPRHGRVTVIYHDPVKVAAFDDRKQLARATEGMVRSGLLRHRGPQIDKG